MAPELCRVACEELMERSVEMAAASLADRRALMSLGMAIEAMMAMMATTIISSISVKPEFLRLRIMCLFVPGLCRPEPARFGPAAAGPSLFPSRLPLGLRGEPPRPRHEPRQARGPARPLFVRSAGPA